MKRSTIIYQGPLNSLNLILLTEDIISVLLRTVRVYLKVNLSLSMYLVSMNGLYRPIHVYMFLLFILGIAQYKMDINISGINDAVQLQNLINEVCMYMSMYMLNFKVYA